MSERIECPGCGEQIEITQVLSDQLAATIRGQLQAKYAAKERELAEQMASRLEGVSCTIESKVSDENRLYGSVGVHDIIEALGKQDIQVEKRMVLLAEPIKETGVYQVPIRVYKEVEPEITVEVVSE